jgi:hypothetical protein
MEKKQITWIAYKKGLKPLTTRIVYKKGLKSKAFLQGLFIKKDYGDFYTRIS